MMNVTPKQVNIVVADGCIRKMCFVHILKSQNNDLI